MFKLDASKPGSSFRDILLLIGGTSIAQCISIIIAPVLSRIYVPEDFANLALYMSILGILCGFSNLAYHLAIPLPEDDYVSRQLLFLCFFLQTVMALLLILVVAFLRFEFFYPRGWESLYRYRLLIPLGFWGSGVYLALFNYTLRQRRFKTLSQTSITQKLWGSSVSVIGGLLGLRPLSLLVGQMLALSAGSLRLFKDLIKDSHFFSVSYAEIVKSMVRYKNFPLYQNWGSLIDTLNANLPALLLMKFYSPETVGLYAFSLRILQFPLSFVGSAVANVFFQRGSVAFRENKLGILTEHYSCLLIVLSTFPFLFFGFVAPDLFEFFFGGIWREAGVIASILCFFLWAQFISSTVSSVLFIREKLALSVSIPAGLFIVTLIIFTLFGHERHFIFFVIYSIGKGAVYLIYLFIVLKIAGSSIGKVGSRLLKEVGLAIMLASPFFLLNEIKGMGLLIMIACSLFIWAMRVAKMLSTR